MSDEEEQFNPTAHKKLLQGISNLGKTQHIRKTTRNEPQRQQDEFQLIKPADEAATRYPVALQDIVGVLKTTERHIDAGKKLKNVQRSKKVLGKPLEKPQAERLKRRLGYEKAKESLERWDALVAQNRSAETQVFPLPSETIYINTALHRRPLQRSIKSELALELEAERTRLRQAKRALAGETENEADLAKREEVLLKKKLTRDELIARRRELKYLKIRESQKSLKARKQNKIKSKKYHKLLKKQKIQDQIKQFEILQKTNPEAALEKLNELEKSRVRERASLRHKNTGSWAKNLQIRAKYDKDVRKDLAEQLQISRQLTQKKTNSDDDENEDGDEAKTSQMDIEKELAADADPFNPWTRVGNAAKKGKQTEEEAKENWRKYWLERNENEKLLDEYKKLLAGDGSDGEDEEEKTDMDVTQVGSLKTEQGEEIESSKKVNSKMEVTINESPKKSSKSGKTKTAKQQMKTPKTKTAQVKTEKEQSAIAGEWLVEDINPSANTKPKEAQNDIDIDEIFDEQEDKIKAKLNKRLKQISEKSKQIQKPQVKDKKQLKSHKEKDPLKNLKDLTFKKQTKYAEIDEELLTNENDETEKQAETVLNNSLPNSGAAKITPQTAHTTENSQPTTTIDPNKLADVKLKQHVNNFKSLNETIDDDNADADMSGDDDEALAHAQQMTISEAFEDDDIVADFTRDKAKDSEIKNAEVDLFMPGWGSWAGAGMSAEKQSAKYKNKRLILKLADKEERRDDNKGELYINEAPSKQLRTHLVSSVPFPFTSVAEYESSIRATIGRNCVPETAFRMLTRPAVIVRKGQVIEPMDETELSKPPRKLKNVVDKRIARLNKANVEKMVKVK